MPLTITELEPPSFYRDQLLPEFKDALEKIKQGRSTGDLEQRLSGMLKMGFAMCQLESLLPSFFATRQARGRYGIVARDLKDVFNEFKDITGHPFELPPIV